MWEYFFIYPEGSCWIECILLHEFIDKYQIKYYDFYIKEYIETIVDLETIRKKEN